MLCVGLFLSEALLKGRQQRFHVQGIFQVEVIQVLGVKVHRGQWGKKAAKINGVRPVGDPVLPGGNQVRPAHQLVHRPHPQLCHDFPQLLRNEQHEVHNVLRLPGKSAPQLRILGSNAHGAGIHVADPHHDAAHRYQRRGGKAEFLGTQNAGNGHIPAAHELPVGLQPHPGPQPVANQCLVGFRKAQLPGETGVVDGAFRRSAGAAVIAGNQHAPGACLGNAGRNGAHACLGDQLHGNAGVPVCVFQIENELGQILNGVNVVVGRGRNQCHAGSGAAGFRNPGVDLFPGQMAALAWLCALGHFDLNLFGTV